MSELGPALPDGTLVAGKLRVIRALGVGGMGTVYEVEHELTRHRRALKLLHAQFSKSSHVVARFLREASAAGRIGSPHIVETFDAGLLDSGEPYLVMEMLDGRSLGDLLEELERIPERDAIEWLAQACDGVQAAHAAGIIHRDIKPDNLFIERSGRVKLLDFGISKFDEVLTGERQLTGDLTLGTPFYMAPEQTSHTSSVDARADVYALGVVLYEAVTGRTPFEAETYPQLIVRIHQGEYEPASSVVASSTLLDEVIAKAMAREPSERFQSAAELGAALRELAVATERAAPPEAPGAAGGTFLPGLAAFAPTPRAGDLEQLLASHRQAAKPLQLAHTQRAAVVPAVTPAKSTPPNSPSAAPARSTDGPTLISEGSVPPPAPSSGAAKLWALALPAIAALGFVRWWSQRSPEAGAPAISSRAEATAAVAAVAIASSVAAPASVAASPPQPSSSAKPATAPHAAKPAAATPSSRAGQHGLDQDNPFK
jgi:serine/threonine-protein kinase